ADWTVASDTHVIATGLATNRCGVGAIERNLVTIDGQRTVVQCRSRKDADVDVATSDTAHCTAARKGVVLHTARNAEWKLDYTVCGGAIERNQSLFARKTKRTQTVVENARK